MFYNNLRKKCLHQKNLHPEFLLKEQQLSLSLLKKTSTVKSKLSKISDMIKKNKLLIGVIAATLACLVGLTVATHHLLKQNLKE
jgi:hypothetical protein